MAKKTTGKEEDKDMQEKSQQSVNEDKEQLTNMAEREEGAVGDAVEDMKGEKETAEKEAGKKKEEADSDDKNGPGPEEKLAELQDKYLRLSAEFDNYRKRTLKERIELIKSAGESILLSLLPVMDDFDRAINLMESAPDSRAMKEGIDLIYSKMREFLKQNGVKEIDALDKDFDTDLHEAVTKIPATDKKKKGKVVDVIQKGYYLNDKVIRYSKVVVGE